MNGNKHGLLLHVPSMQSGVEPPQMLPQAPQLLGSELKYVQFPLQRTAPCAQAYSQ
jgi:hypothetical protein